jgi:hypothetical protein
MLRHEGLRLTAAELIIVRPLNLSEQDLYRLLADSVYVARLSNGARVRDVGDFREWLLELAAASEREVYLLGGVNGA